MNLGTAGEKSVMISETGSWAQNNCSEISPVKGSKEGKIRYRRRWQGYPAGALETRAVMRFKDYYSRRLTAFEALLLESDT